MTMRRVSITIALLVSAHTTAFVPNRRPAKHLPRLRATRTAIHRRERVGMRLLDRFKDKNIERLESQKEFDQHLKAHDDKVVVVKFYSSYCKACQRMAPKFKKAAHEYTTDLKTEVDGTSFTFAEVEWSVNKQMCRSLQLKIIPSVMMFYKGTKIEQFVCRPDQVSILTRKLGNYRELGWPAAWELELKLDQEEKEESEEAGGSDPDNKPTVIAMTTIASNLKDEAAVAEAFREADVDGNGTLTVEELAGLAKTLGSEMEEGELRAALNTLDVDNSGDIDYEEFVGWWAKSIQDG